MDAFGQRQIYFIEGCLLSRFVTIIDRYFRRLRFGLNIDQNLLDHFGPAY